MLPRATRAVSSAFPIRTTAPISLHAISSSVSRARPCIAAAAAAAGDPSAGVQQQQQRQELSVAETYTPNQDRLASSSQATTSTPTSGSSLGSTTQDGTPGQRPQRKWRSRDHGPLPPELRPAPKPRQRFLVFAENSAKQALPVIVQELRSQGQCLLLAPSDPDVCRALQVLHFAQEELSKHEPDTQLLVKVMCSPNAEEGSPYLADHPAQFALQLHIVCYSASAVQRHLRYGLSRPHTLYPDPWCEDSTYVKVGIRGKDARGRAWWRARGLGEGHRQIHVQGPGQRQQTQRQTQGQGQGRRQARVTGRGKWWDGGKEGEEAEEAQEGEEEEGEREEEGQEGWAGVQVSGGVEEEDDEEQVRALHWLRQKRLSARMMNEVAEHGVVQASTTSAAAAAAAMRALALVSDALCILRGLDAVVAITRSPLAAPSAAATAAAAAAAAATAEAGGELAGWDAATAKLRGKTFDMAEASGAGTSASGAGDSVVLLACADGDGSLSISGGSNKVPPPPPPRTVFTLMLALGVDRELHAKQLPLMRRLHERNQAAAAQQEALAQQGQQRGRGQCQGQGQGGRQGQGQEQGHREEQQQGQGQLPVQDDGQSTGGMGGAALATSGMQAQGRLSPQGSLSSMGPGADAPSAEPSGSAQLKGLVRPTWRGRADEDAVDGGTGSTGVGLPPLPAVRSSGPGTKPVRKQKLPSTGMWLIDCRDLPPDPEPPQLSP